MQMQLDANDTSGIAQNKSDIDALKTGFALKANIPDMSTRKRISSSPARSGPRAARGNERFV